MRKLFLIAWKDLTLIFRDRAALLLMLVAPFLLTLGMGLLTGRFSRSSNTGINDIPVAIVNQDGGQLGDALVQVYQSGDLAELVEPVVLDQPAEAKAGVDEDTYAAAIIIPAGFSASIIPTGETNKAGPLVQVEFYANPTQPTNAGILRTILEQFISQVEIGRVSGEVIISQLVSSHLLDPAQAGTLGAQLGNQLASSSGNSAPITLKTVTASGEAVNFDILAYMAPGMALMFLMFTVTYGARSLLVEERMGTLPRMLVSPTTSAQILGGKVFGVFLTAVAQMLILIGASSLLFRLQWGDPLAVLLLVLGCAAGATGWGLLLASFFKTPGQIASVGSAVMLLFGILGGSFFDISLLPGWVSTVSVITPNAWGISGFTTLAMGGRFGNILTPLLALFGMGVLLFAIAVWRISRRGLGKR